MATFQAAKLCDRRAVGITAMGMTMFSQAFVPTAAICISPPTRSAYERNSCRSRLRQCTGLMCRSHSVNSNGGRSHRDQSRVTAAHPTSFRAHPPHRLGRMAPMGSRPRLTLKAGDQLAFTFDSGSRARAPTPCRRYLTRAPSDALHARSRSPAPWRISGPRSRDAGPPPQAGHEAGGAGRSPRHCCSRSAPLSAEDRSRLLCEIARSQNSAPAGPRPDRHRPQRADRAIDLSTLHLQGRIA